MAQTINIKFPFQDSPKNFFLNTNTVSTDAITSDVLHVLLTQKGQRLYNPDFGTNLYQYLFDPNDNVTLEEVKNEANASLKQSMPNIQIISLTAVNNENSITLSLVINNSEDVFQQDIFIQVEI